MVFFILLWLKISNRFSWQPPPEKTTGKMKKFLTGDENCTAGCQINNYTIPQTNTTLNPVNYKARIDFKEIFLVVAFLKFFWKTKNGSNFWCKNQAIIWLWYRLILKQVDLPGSFWGFSSSKGHLRWLN